MFDTHAHVHDAAFDDDRDATVARARDAGIERILTIGCDLADSARAQAAAERYGLDYSIGIHPHEAEDAPPDIAGAFDALAARGTRAPLAIGEIGLDYYYDHSPRDVQRRVLDEQLAYARRARLPVVFHQREAFDDFIAALRDGLDGLPGVVHCFTGDPAQAERLVGEFGLKLGIGGVVTFKTAEHVRDSVRAVGIEHLILETDCPYLAPVPYRGKRNEPAFIASTASHVAELLDLPLAEVISRTTATASALFGAYVREAKRVLGTP
jgi:TatD DNase family protein